MGSVYSLLQVKRDGRSRIIRKPAGNVLDRCEHRIFQHQSAKELPRNVAMGVY